MTAITATVPATTTTRSGSASRRTVRTVRAASVAAATAATSVFFEATKAAGTEYMIFNAQKGEMVPFHVYEIAMVTFVVATLGWVTLALFERYTRRPRRNWVALACAVLALSFVPIPLSVMSGGTQVALAVVHVIVGAALAPMVRGDLVRSRRNR